ncbi:MAG: GNAT family N-acetyltransferase [Sulfuricaulis sp.]
MQISYLADHPDFIEILAPWVLEHWRPILTQATLKSRVAILRAHMNRDVLPIAWVAHSESQVFGTAALRVHDLPGREDLAPWLGGVYVAPPFRARGIGAALCAAVEQKAKTFFETEMLYLFTLDRQAWYRSLGWSMYEPCSWCGRSGDIMFKKIHV